MSEKLICLAFIAFVLGLASGTSGELLVRWTFDEGSGTVAADISGNARDGTFAGEPQWVTGHDGAGALHFDGVDDYVTHALPGDQTYDAFTISMWVKTDGPDQADLAGVFASRFPGGATGAGFQIDVARATQVYQVRPNGGNGVFGDATTDWVHLAMVCEGTSAQLYYQGVLSNNTTLVSSLINEFTMGVNRQRNRFFAGTVDELRVYDRALSAVEILEAMEGEPWPYAFGPNPRDGTMLEATWVYLSWASGDMAVSHDVYFGENFDDVSTGAGQTFLGNQPAASLLIGLAGSPYPEGLVPGTTYYWRVDEVNNAEPNSPWKGPIWSFSIPPRTAYYPNPADGAGSVPVNASLGWTPGYGAKLHTVYFGEKFDDVNSAAMGTVVGSAAYNPGPLQRQKVYYWRVDETDPPNIYKGQVWSFATVGAVGSPYPANGASSVEMNIVLTWTPSDDAASHQVYFGSNKAAVRKADTTSPEYKGIRALGAETYDPGLLVWGSTYYWRIDEVNNTNPESPWKGPVWSFTTGDYLVVDDIESYNDLPETDAGSNRIYTKWIDGFGTTTNGALVGNLDVPLTERTNVHGGTQAMPLSYDNNLKFSEATLTLTSGNDWTRQGVVELSLWFRGVAANAAERMYVALNGIAVVYNDDTTMTQKTAWTHWVIPLQQFADQGVNLSNVTSITIGLGTRGNTTTAGGTGQMYFDDISLYRPGVAP